MDSFDAFEQAACRAFGFLRDRFGYAPPELERLGREAYVRFRKGPRIVSIAWEPGSPPIVELFFPSVGSGHPATPWAEVDGVPYARRFPRRVDPPQSQPPARRETRRNARRWHEPSPALLEEYLLETAAGLERTETEFLSEEG